MQLLLENGADPRLYSSDGQRALDAATSEPVKELLKNWNVQLTDRMLAQIERSRLELKQEQMQGLEARKRAAEVEYKRTSTQYELVKTELLRCTQELQRLNDEYLLNEAMYGALIDKKEAEKSELTAKHDKLRLACVKARISYKDMLSELRKERRQIKKSKSGLDQPNEEEINENEGKWNFKHLKNQKHAFNTKFSW